jgi:poly-gamma-glutamate synthesis protein (capsule biosynthesis protein)
MCGDSFYAVGHGVGSSLSKLKGDFLRTEIADFLHSHWLVLGNIECALSDVGRIDRRLRSVQMRGRPECAGYLAKWGITVANVANNHILEHGHEAARDTVEQLHKAGIETIGCGRDGTFRGGIKVAEVERSGQTVALIGACFRQEKYAFNGGTDLANTIKTIQTLSNDNKLVIVSVHWGDEFIDRPSLDQKRTAREFIHAGATLVIGHHPHVVQGIENLNGRLIAYSLGNFIFDSFLEDTKWSIILSVEISGRDVAGWEYVPITRNAEHRPLFATGDQTSRLAEELERRCALLKTNTPAKLYDEQYRSDLMALETTARYKLRLQLLSRALRINPIFWPQILYRPVRRRMGRW